MAEQNLYQKLSMARTMLQSKKIKKSGHNAYSGFDYFELSDFLPAVNDIFTEIGLTSLFTIKQAQRLVSGEELAPAKAELKIVNADNPKESFTFETPLADTGMKASDIQKLGAQHTYLRRYLWLEAMEICEHDAVDATSGSDKAEPKKERHSKVMGTITPRQLSILLSVYKGDNLAKLLEFNGITSLNDMSCAKASELITRLHDAQEVVNDIADSGE